MRWLVRLLRGTPYVVLFHPAHDLRRVESTNVYARSKSDALQRVRVSQFPVHGDIRVVYINEVQM